MLVELVRVETADGMTLDGAWTAPSGELPDWNVSEAPWDGALLLHGVNG